MNPAKSDSYRKILRTMLMTVLAASIFSPEILVRANEILAPTNLEKSLRPAAGPVDNRSDNRLLLAPGDQPYKTYLPYLARPGLNVTHFVTLSPGSVLPSEADCAASVKPKTENKRMNITYNNTKGSQKLASDYFGPGDPIMNAEIAPRVTGNFTGTTDEILQWAACKWGIDEDIVRAQAARESWWQMTNKGDWSNNPDVCPPGHGLGIDGVPGYCPESWGIMQVRYIYRTSAWPSSANSTAFNVDVAYSEWRVCYEGYEWWLTTDIGDQWGCVGRWFAGRWHTDEAEWYINEVKTYLNDRVWEKPNFQEP